MTDGPLLLGLDLGISTAKAALFTPTGELIALESEEYLIIPEGDRVEADPEVYWAPVVHSIRRLLSKWGGDADRIRAVSVSSHAETVIPLGADGEPTRPAIVWMDNRSQTEADELTDTIGSQRVLEISGQPEIGPIWPVTRYRWLSRHEPETVRRTAKYLLPEDYLLYRLSGEFVGEQTLWSSSLVYDIRKKALSDEMMEFGRVAEDKLPRIFPPGTPIGRIRSRCADETGLSTSTIVVTGALDQLCSAIAAGNVRPGIVTESTGSVLALVATIADPVFDARRKMPCHIHAVPDLYCLLPWNPTGGLALKWFKDRFAERDAEVARAAGQDIYSLLSEEAARVPPGSSGLVMLPHLEGAYFPEFNASARAVFFGFTLKHSRGHFVRAIMEAVAFMIRRDLEGIQQLGIEAREIRVLGGGAKSRLWSQIKADVCRVPVIVPRHGEAAVLGAAILAAVGCNLHEDIPGAVKCMAREGDMLEPDPKGSEVYERAFSLYVALYESVKTLYARSGSLDPFTPASKETW
jgi:sugar (pentulose or hexulose) kinase